MNTAEKQIAVMETKYEDVFKKLATIDNRLAAIEVRMESILKLLEVEIVHLREMVKGK